MPACSSKFGPIKSDNLWSFRWTQLMFTSACILHEQTHYPVLAYSKWSLSQLILNKAINTFYYKKSSLCSVLSVRTTAFLPHLSAGILNMVRVHLLEHIRHVHRPRALSASRHSWLCFCFYQLCLLSAYSALMILSWVHIKVLKAPLREKRCMSTHSIIFCSMPQSGS